MEVHHADENAVTHRRTVPCPCNARICMRLLLQLDTPAHSGATTTPAPRKKNGLGQRILQNLAFQLGGQIVLEHGDGTVATMVFRPRTEAAARVKA